VSTQWTFNRDGLTLSSSTTDFWAELDFSMGADQAQRQTGPLPRSDQMKRKAGGELLVHDHGSHGDDQTNDRHASQRSVAAIGNRSSEESPFGNIGNRGGRLIAPTSANIAMTGSRRGRSGGGQPVGMLHRSALTGTLATRSGNEARSWQAPIISVFHVVRARLDRPAVAPAGF